MKKILLSTIILTGFALSIILFEISCKKSANADPSSTLPIATTSRLGGVIPDGSTISVDATGKISAVNNGNTQQNKILYAVPYSNASASGVVIWSANYDGTNAQKLNISIPSGSTIGGNTLTLSPDHKTIFFEVVDNNGFGVSYIYACNIDGTNPHKVVTSFKAVAY